MIARHWRGRVRSRDVDAYVEYVIRTGIARQRATQGNEGSMMLVQAEEGEADVVVLSLWDSLEAIRRFAGEQVDRAVFFPEDARYLISSDSVVRHYEVRAYSVGRTSPAPVTAGISHRSYSDGCVQSLGFSTVEGEATVGVMAPGSHRFTAALDEHVTVLAGELDVRLAGASRVCGVGETYVVPAGTDFEVRAGKPVAYLCRFVRAGEAGR